MLEERTRPPTIVIAHPFLPKEVIGIRVYLSRIIKETWYKYQEYYEGIVAFLFPVVSEVFLPGWQLSIISIA